MRRSLLSSGVPPALSAGACAQSVTAYGIVDVAVEHVTNVGASGSGLTRMPSLTGSVPSRIGFRGVEDLGGGLRAVFTIEQGFAPDASTLSQGGRGGGRLSWASAAPGVR